MGGKTKAQRTKNNAKPSNSTRSAELLSSVPANFTSFSSFSDANTTGFSTIESLSDKFDSNVNSEFLIILRKMSKKDPTTKVKALKEFSELIAKSEVDVCKSILPFWPKFYQNLGIDCDHRVREGTQEVQSLIVSKCKKFVAPYLKHLAPTWIASQFDVYAPASSISYSSFQTAFPGQKAGEVCLFCQNEIMDYVVKNLTLLSPAELNMSKSCVSEEVEQKYQRIVCNSLKSLSFFIMKTCGRSITSNGFEELLKHQKFWSFSKHQSTQIRSAWFELMNSILQCCSDKVLTIKSQLIMICFHNIDETDSLVIPHIWGCILLLQKVFDDWSTCLNFKKHIQGKITSILRSCCNGNATVICPNFLPFISKLSEKLLDNEEYVKFFEHFFEATKTTMTTNELMSKKDCSALVCAYFECLRFLFQKFDSQKEKPTALHAIFFHKYVIQIIQWGLTADSFVHKYIFSHSPTILGYLVKNEESILCSFLLKEFWTNLMRTVAEYMSQNRITVLYIEHATLLISHLFFANQNLQVFKVKFSDCQKASDYEHDHKLNSEKTLENKLEGCYFNSDLRNLTLLLVRFCIDEARKNKSVDFLSPLGKLTKYFSDIDFYAKISPENSIDKTLSMLVFFIKNSDFEPMETVLDIIFDILGLLNNQERVDYIKNNLLTIERPIIQQWAIQRLMSFPMCVQAEVRIIFSEQHVVEVISKIAKEAVENNSKDNFNLLHKCFFQNDSGEIPINHNVVDVIVKILLNALSDDEKKHMIDSCASFLSQIMPVICSKNSARSTQIETFLKLFEFTIENSENEYLSKDTLWEVTTCWQDVLSSEDIIVDSSIVSKCTQITTKYLNTHTDVDEIEKVANSLSKLIMFSTENIQNETERFEKINFLTSTFLQIDETQVFGYDKKRVYDYCTFLEAMKGSVSISSSQRIIDECMKNIDLKFFAAWKFLSLSVVSNLFCDTDDTNEASSQYESMNVDDNINEFKKKIFPIKMWQKPLYELLQEIICSTAVSESFINIGLALNSSLKNIVLKLSEKLKYFLQHGNSKCIEKLRSFMFTNASQNNIDICRSLSYLTATKLYGQYEENSVLLLAEDLIVHFVEQQSILGYISTLQYMLPKLSAKAISLQSSVVQGVRNDLWSYAAFLRCIISNNFNDNCSDMSNKEIIAQTLHFIVEVSEKQQTDKDMLLYNVEIRKQDIMLVSNVVEYIYLLIDVISKFSHSLSTKHWDAVRLGLSSWVLTVSKSVNNLKNLKAAIFISAVYKLFDCLVKFFAFQKEKSSSLLCSTIIEEWEHLFAREVNLVLFNCFYKSLQLEELSGEYSMCYSTLIDEITPAIEMINYSVIFNFYRRSGTNTLDDLIHFLLKNISKPMHSIRTTCVYIVKRLTPLYIGEDIENYQKNEQTAEGKNADSSISDWHFLSKFRDYIVSYETPIVKYLEEFSFKLTELSDLKPIDRDESFNFLFIWECIAYVSSEAPAELRSLYTMWLRENKYEQSLLPFLFRAMPIEILKNHDSKIMNNDLFKGLTWNQIKDKNLTIEKYACHIYTDVLRKLPAIVRKWWNASSSRQKTFVDKLTTNFVSSIICQEELNNISLAKEKHENMMVTVHTSTREVFAVYLIDEVRMELVITLAKNYPLGGVKVDSGKQIGGKASSRNIGMQLTIFLTHQNGSIFDGLTLWKNNLDKKFEGVEECYVCYTVIHQDTCQLPKLTCKTCKKKFHGPCLYKWFTTSSKSTCPICRNIF